MSERLTIMNYLENVFAFLFDVMILGIGYTSFEVVGIILIFFTNVINATLNLFINK